MINEAEITDRTGIVYLRRGVGTPIGEVLGGTINLLNPTFSWAGTGEVIRPKPNVQPSFSQGLLPSNLLSTTTGSELHDLFAGLLVLLVLEIAFDDAVTDYHTRFQIEDSMRAKLRTGSIEQAPSPDTNSASIQAERLREISGLKVERLAEIFGVSRTTYYKWLAGFPLHDVHREHLLEVLSLVEEAAQRLGSPGATNTWLLTPVSPGGKKPIDYLTAQQYNTFRGFLLRVRTGQETFRPLTPSNRTYQKRSPEEVKDSLERLRPRAWRDRDDDANISDEEV